MDRIRRVLVADDHEIIGTAVKYLLESTEHWRVCGVVCDYGQVVDAVRRDKPDVVALDIIFCDQPNGLNLIPEIMAAHSDVRILVMSQLKEKIGAVVSLTAGAHGYLMKMSLTENLIPVLDVVSSGKKYMSEEIKQRMLGAIPHSPRSNMMDKLGGMLTPREWDVFLQLAQGYGPKNIAQVLGLAVKTVETHQQRLQKRFCLQDAAELRQFVAAWASNCNLLPGSLPDKLAKS